MACIVMGQLSERDLNQVLLAHSEITMCKIVAGPLVEMTISEGRTNYLPVVKDIWTSMGPAQIFEDTTYNLEGGQLGRGWGYFAEHDFSFRRRDASHTLKEIVRLAKKNGWELNMDIRLREGGRITIAVPGEWHKLRVN